MATPMVTIERHEGALVAVINGRVDGTTAPALLEELLSSVAEGSPMVADLEGLSYISSAGLRVVVQVARELREKKAGFAVCSLSDQVRQVFDMSGFDQIIQICDSRDEALTAVSDPG